jgi:predicted Zn-dependent peptidase
MRAAERLFGRVPASGDPRDCEGSPPAPSSDRRLIDRPARQAQLLPLAGGDDADYAAVTVLGPIIGGGMAGRLFVALPGEDALAYSLGVMTPLRTGPGFLVADGAAAPRNVTLVEGRMFRELASILDQGVTEAEVARAKAQVVGQLAVEPQTKARQACDRAHDELLGGRVGTSLIAWRTPCRA